MLEKSLIEYVNAELARAKQHMAEDKTSKGNKEFAEKCFQRAFGAVEFFNRAIWQTNPEAMTRTIDRWEDEWRPAFEQTIWG